MNLRQQIDTGRMSPYQWTIVGLCVFLNMLDGYDVAAMSFTATRVQQDFGLSGSELGVVISGTLIGMAIGSLLMGVVADRIGRRPTVLISVAAATVGMIAASMAPTVLVLGICRVVTGLGVGGILACVTVIISEYTSQRTRALAIGLYSAGYGIGATIGGLVAVALQSAHGWRSVFLVGAVISALGLALLVALLPESVDFLATRRPADLETRLTRIARRLRLPAESAAITAAEAARPRTGATGPASAGATLRGLLTAGLLRVTLLLWLAFFATMFGFYFVNTWTPRLLVSAGMTADQGVIVGVALALGGAVGSVLYGALAARFSRRRLLIAFLLLSAAMSIVFVLTTSVLWVAFVVGGLIGLLVNGCVAGLYTLAPGVYEPQVRATGVGMALGVGRTGAILAPIGAGILLDAGYSTLALYGLVGVVFLIGATAVALIRTPSGRSLPAATEVAA